MFTPHAREIAILGVSHTQFVSAPWKGGGKHERLVFAKQVFLETGKTENNETQRTMPVTVGSGSATGRPTSTDVNGHSSLSFVVCFVVLGFSIVFSVVCIRLSVCSVALDFGKGEELSLCGARRALHNEVGWVGFKRITATLINNRLILKRSFGLQTPRFTDPKFT